MLRRIFPILHTPRIDSVYRATFPIKLKIMKIINMLISLINILTIVGAAPASNFLKRDDPLLGCCGVGNNLSPPACQNCHLPGKCRFDIGLIYAA